MRALIFLASAILTACTGLSLESKAAAAYGSFVVAEHAAATLVNTPSVPDSTKLQIQKDDAAAKPYADALLAAITSYRQSPANSDALQNALDAALPAITTLATETKP